MRPRYADLFRRMRDPDIRAADAAYDAVLFDRDEAVPDLIECYDKSRRDHEMRFLCVQLLGFSGSTAALPTLVAALSDAHPRVRAEACRSLEDLAPRSAVAALEARLTDVDEEVRLAASEALAHIRSPERAVG